MIQFRFMTQPLEPQVRAGLEQREASLPGMAIGEPQIRHRPHGAVCSEDWVVGVGAEWGFSSDSTVTTSWDDAIRFCTGFDCLLGLDTDIDGGSANVDAESPKKDIWDTSIPLVVIRGNRIANR